MHFFSMTGEIKEKFNWKKELDTCQVPWAGFWIPMEKENAEAKSNGSNFQQRYECFGGTFRSHSVPRDKVCQNQEEDPSHYI